MFKPKPQVPTHSALQTFHVDAAGLLLRHDYTADVIGGCLRAGLTLELFEEYDHDISNVYRDFQDFEHKPAVSYALIARKRD